MPAHLIFDKDKVSVCLMAVLGIETHDRDDWALVVGQVVLVPLVVLLVVPVVVLVVVLVPLVVGQTFTGEIIKHFFCADDWEVIADYCSVQERK